MASIEVGNLAQLAAATAGSFAVIVGALGVRRFFQERIIEFDRRYRALRPHVRTMRETLKANYSAFRERFQKGNPEAGLPEEIADLAQSAGIPPNMPQANWYGSVTGDLLKWREQNGGNLTACQFALLEFVSGIYPARKSTASSLDEKAEAFETARGEVSWFWESEAWPYPVPKHIRRHYASSGDLLIVMCWLEIVLQEHLTSPGPGKIRLFEAVRNALR